MRPVDGGQLQQTHPRAALLCDRVLRAQPLSPKWCMYVLADGHHDDRGGDDHDHGGDHHHRGTDHHHRGGDHHHRGADHHHRGTDHHHLDHDDHHDLEHDDHHAGVRFHVDVRVHHPQLRGAPPGPGPH